MMIKLLVLRCSNIEETKKFYALLGFMFVREKHGKGSEHYSSEMNGFVLELYPALKGEVDNSRLGFEVEKLASKLETLTIHKQYKFQGKTTRVIIDPDGRKIEIYEK